METWWNKAILVIIYTFENSLIVET